MYNIFQNSDDLFSVEPLAPSNVESSAEQIVVHDAINVQNPNFNVQQNYDVVAMDSKYKLNEIG